MDVFNVTQDTYFVQSWVGDVWKSKYGDEMVQISDTKTLSQHAVLFVC